MSETPKQNERGEAAGEAFSVDAFLAELGVAGEAVDPSNPDPDFTGSTNDPLDPTALDDLFSDNAGLRPAAPEPESVSEPEAEPEPAPESDDDQTVLALGVPEPPSGSEPALANPMVQTPEPQALSEAPAGQASPGTAGILFPPTQPIPVVQPVATAAQFTATQPGPPAATQQTAAPPTALQPAVPVPREPTPVPQVPQGQTRPVMAHPPTLPAEPSRRKQTGWKQMTAAIVGGIVAGLVAAVVISDLASVDEPIADAAVTASSEPATELAESADSATEAAEAAPPTMQWDLSEPLVFNAVRFDSGTTTLSDTSRASLDGLIATLANHPDAVAAVTVRTYSELSAAANQTLSTNQATALIDYFTAAGFGNDRVRVEGIGSLPPSAGHPTANFVIAGSGIGQPKLKELLGTEAAFSLGIDTATRDVRVESRPQLAGLAELLLADPDARLSLAGYSFAEPTADQNRAIAAQAADTIAHELIQVYGIAPDRLDVVTPGAAPFAVPTELGGLITLRIGPRPNLAHELLGVDLTGLTLDDATGGIAPSSAPTLDQLAAALNAAPGRAVLDVATFSAGSASANRSLSQTQAEAIVAALAERGVDPTRLQASGSGADTNRPSLNVPAISVTVASN